MAYQLDDCDLSILTLLQRNARILRGTYDELAEGFRALVDNYVETKYGGRG
jgi:DNA-binding Lrp family transcriptional regulator